MLLPHQIAVRIRQMDTCGPHQPNDKAVFYITRALFIVLSLIVIGGIYITGGR